MKKIYLAFFLLINLFATAQTFDVGNLRYTVTSGTNVNVSKTGICPTGVLNIPATVVNAGTTYTITGLGNEAFRGCSGITSVTFPNSVTSIGSGAFRDSDFTSVTVNWVTPLTVGSTVFSGIILSQKTLNVPQGSMAAYKAADIWKNFGQVIELIPPSPAPQKISYQAVIRNSANTLVVSTAVGMKISILQGSPSGSAVYEETHTPTTNLNGLVSIEIGGGTVVTGTIAGIDWANGPYFIKTETDPTGGTTYTITGTSQLLSVPYALYAKTSGSSTPGPQGVQGVKGDQGLPGTKGDKGDTGEKGEKGDTGSNGIAGEKGEKGEKGDTGSNGIAGDKGEKGEKGDTGSNGAAGEKGEKGDTGSNGAAGEKGEKGDTGSNGAAGEKGEKGDTGSNGAAGEKGDKGEKGDDGQGLPTGGTTGQVLSKIDGTDFSTQWITPSLGGGASQLELITREDNKTGHRILGKNPTYYGGIGINAVDLSNATFGTGYGATGDGSFATGDATKASGQSSTAVGVFSVASGQASFSAGNANTASGTASVAMGSSNSASNTNSVAMGYESFASGVSSVAIGQGTKAKSFGETVVGAYNTDYTPASTAGSTSTDRAFTVGIGSSILVPMGPSMITRRDGLIVYKNGNTDIGGQAKLNTNSTGNSFTLPTTRGTANQVLQTDGAGETQWVTPASGGSGAISAPIIIRSGSTTLDGTHHTIIMTFYQGTITLPAANTCSGRMYRIVTSFKAGDTITISTYKDLSGNNKTIMNGGQTMLIQSDGTNWYQVGQ